MKYHRKNSCKAEQACLQEELTDWGITSGINRKKRWGAKCIAQRKLSLAPTWPIRFVLCWKKLEITDYWHILDKHKFVEAREKEKHTQETEEKCLMEKELFTLAIRNTGTQAGRYLIYSTKKSPNLCHLQSKSHTGSTHPPQTNQDRKAPSPNTPSSPNNQREKFQKVWGRSCSFTSQRSRLLRQ